MKRYIYATMIAGAALLYTGCTDDFGQSTTKYAGNDIVFGGRATYELNENKSQKAPATRTVYTGEILNSSGTTWKEGDGTKYEGIHWVNGDKVRIFSKEAIGTTVADYTVNVSEKEDAIGVVELTKIGNVGLQWSNETTYDFYAVYPSPHQYPLTSEGGLDATVDKNVLNNATTITGTIPVVQTPTTRTDDGNGNYTFAPNMQYAYMVAHQHVADANKTSEEIYLNFTPIATAVEIELYNAINADNSYSDKQATLGLANVLISAKTAGTKICGDFTADLTKLEETADGTFSTIPSDFVSEGTNTYEQITIPMYSDGLYGDPTTLAPGKSIKFTIFMLPTTNVEDLKITIQGATGAATGSTTGININVHKKTYLKKMPITKAVMPFDQSKWIEYLPDNAYLKGLSIPGAGGATSGHLTTTAWDADSTYLEQKYPISKLWAYGIRCFEFTVDRSTATTPDLGAQDVFCNTINTGLSLAQAVDSVKAQLEANPDEFAMVIITYQQQTGWNLRNETTGKVTKSRDPQAFMEQLNDFWSTKVTGGTWTYAKGTKLYSTNLTVDDARGHLFCIARPTSEGEDNYVDINTSSQWFGSYYKINSLAQDTLTAVSEVDENIMVIHGWGALKDKWEARGYTSCIFHRGTRNSAFTKAVDTDGYGTLLKYDAKKPGRPFDVANTASGVTGTLTDDYVTSRYETLSPNFYYKVQSGTTALTPKGAWVQEWARVSKGVGPTTSAVDGFYTYWPSSLEEKKKRVEECLDYALAQKIDGEAASGVVFINSLCGYYVATSIPNSCRPNSLTESNVAYTLAGNNGEMKLGDLSGANNESGMSGNISSFASEMNTYFYNYLQKKVEGSDFVPGPMGIILMDRVGQDVASTQIPSIIIANNFQHVLDAAPATLSLPRTDLEEGDVVAAPKRRSASEESGEMKIVWE